MIFSNLGTDVLFYNMLLDRYMSNIKAPTHNTTAARYQPKFRICGHDYRYMPRFETFALWRIHSRLFQGMWKILHVAFQEVLNFLKCIEILRQISFDESNHDVLESDHSYCHDDLSCDT